jgi:hypothetical protein
MAVGGSMAAARVAGWNSKVVKHHGCIGRPSQEENQYMHQI